MPIVLQSHGTVQRGNQHSIRSAAENSKPRPLVNGQPTLMVASSWNHLLSLKAGGQVGQAKSLNIWFLELEIKLLHPWVCVIRMDIFLLGNKC